MRRGIPDRPPAGGRDGWLSVTHDAFGANPVIHAATLNPPSETMLTNPGGVSHYVSVDLAPDGTPWAAFWTDCRQNGQFVDASCAQKKRKKT